MDVRTEAMILAHQGGWDEILMVLAPLVIFGGLLMLANRRADRLDQPEADSVESSSEAGDQDLVGTDKLEDESLTDE